MQVYKRSYFRMVMSGFVATSYGYLSQHIPTASMCNG